MGEDIGPHHARVIAFVLRLERLDRLEVLLELLRRQSPRGRRAQELDVDALRFPRVHVGARAVADLGALRGKELGHGLDPGLDFEIDFRDRIGEHDGDLEIAQALLARLGQRELVPRGVDLVGPGHDAEADLEVLGAPAERPDHGDVRLGHTPRQRLAAWRHDAPGRLVTEDAAVVRGVADGGADIAARLEAGEACGQGGRGAAGGATRRAAQVPGIVRRAVDGVVALIVGEVDGDIGLAEEDHARAEEAIHGEGIARRDMVLELGHAPGRRHTDHVIGFLDGHGHAVERSPGLLARQSPVGRARPLAGPLEIGRDDGVERRIVLLDASEIELEELCAADLLATDQ